MLDTVHLDGESERQPLGVLTHGLRAHMTPPSKAFQMEWPPNGI
ncbi:hypothetical protein [Roseateles sp. LYH14W]|uniref:Uncharacterized protein n=1 Tax=Pelomonas parva TaxID=3299032 RepID=A0ABW7EZT5_9BURK